MAGSQGKQRGEPDAKRAQLIKKRWMVALVGASLVAGAIAIALAVREETCDVGKTLNPQDRAIICAMRDRDPSACPTRQLSPEECTAILQQFNHPAG